MSELSEEENPFRILTGDSQNLPKRNEKEIEKDDFYKKKIKKDCPDPNLEEGRRLPQNLQKLISSDLINKPIEEIDNYYKNKETFLVINDRYEIFRFSKNNSLWIFDPFNTIRKGAIYITVHPWFLIFMTLTVLTVTFIISTPLLPRYIGAIFTVIYTLEIALKVIARGFIFHPFTYLRYSWNWLDFIVTIMSYFCMVMDLGAIAGFEAIRGLRLLKMDAIFSPLRPLVRSILQSVKNLGELSIFTFFALTVTAIWGTQHYMGVLTQKCIKQFPMDGSWGNFSDENWERFNSNFSNWDYERVCGNSSGTGQCLPGYHCLQGYGGNPNYGYTSFDTFGWSLLSALRLMTQDYWEDLYRLILKTAGPWHMTIFICFIFFLSLNFLNLILSVVTVTFNEIMKQNEEDKELKQSVIQSDDTKLERLDNNLIDNNKSDTTVDIQDVTDNNGTVTATEKTKCSKITDLLCIWDYCDCWISFRKALASVVLHPFAELFFIFIILLNTIFMALDHHDMDVSLDRTLRTGNYIFTLIFAFEVTSKIIAMHPKYYFKKGWNIFDFIVVALCVLELGLEGVQGLSILRMFRIFRLVKLFQLTRSSWSVLNYLVCVIGKTLGPLANLAFLMIIVSFVFGVIGMNMFGINYIDNIERFPEAELPRWSFIDAMHSFMVVFRAFCGEWIESMWDCMLIGDISCVPFFIACVVLGLFIIKNLFLSVILHSFATCDRTTPIEDEDVNKMIEAFNKLGLSFKKNKIESEERTENEAYSGYSPKISKIIRSKYFEVTVTTIIVLSTIALALEDVFLSSRPILESTLQYMTIVFTVLFLTEMIFIWIGLGFKKYFTSTWYWLDFIVVLASVLHLMAPFCGLTTQIFKTMRSLRFLRILRCKNTGEKKIVLDALTKAVPDIFGTLILSALIWLVFAIMGVQMFAGKYFKCVDDEGTVLSYEIIPDIGACIQNNYTWENSLMNFDDVGKAYLSLTQIATFKGWIQIMNDAVDSRMVDMQPIREVNIYMYWYFVCFILFGAFLTINLFVGVIVKSYCEQKKLSLGQKSAKYCNAMARIEAKKPEKAVPKPKWKLQAVLYDAVTHKHFEAIMLIFILLNALAMVMDHYQLKLDLALVLDYSNLVFMLVFIVECLLKMIALRQYYFNNCWNNFDLILVLLQIFNCFIGDLMVKYFMMVPVALVRLVRLVKIRKNIRLIKNLKGLRTLFFALGTSFRSLWAIFVVLFTVTIVYAIFGMSFFMHVKENGAIDDTINFQTFGGTMILLFQISTWAGWDGVLYGLINEVQCPFLPVFYLVSYIFVSFLIYNVYVGVVLTNYVQAIEDEEEGLTQDDVNMFYQIWQKFDPLATEYIRSDQLSDFLEALEEPFKIRKYNQTRIDRLDIAVDKNNQVFYKDVLKALVNDFFLIN